jgi:hypothetical protein
VQPRLWALFEVLLICHQRPPAVIDKHVQCCYFLRRLIFTSRRAQDKTLLITLDLCSCLWKCLDTLIFVPSRYFQSPSLDFARWKNAQYKLKQASNVADSTYFMVFAFLNVDIKYFPEWGVVKAAYVSDSMQNMEMLFSSLVQTIF